MSEMRHSKQILSHTKSPTKKSKKFNIPCTWNVRPLYVRVCAFIPNAGKCSNVNWYPNKRMQGNMRSPIHACIYPSACTSNFMGATCGCLPRKSECKQGNRKKSKLLWIYFANKTANTHTHTFVYTISIIMNMNNSRLSRGTMLVGVDASRYIFINWSMFLNLFLSKFPNSYELACNRSSPRLLLRNIKKFIHIVFWQNCQLTKHYLNFPKTWFCDVFAIAFGWIIFFIPWS